MPCSQLVPRELRRRCWKVRRLKADCKPGKLFFSVAGLCLQDGLSWDFDGDYFQVIAHPDFVDLEPESQMAPDPSTSTVPERGCWHEQPSLQEVQTHFLRTFPLVDHMGLYYHQW